MTDSNFDSKFEEAIIFVSSKLSQVKPNKPTLLHGIRVGLNLYEKNYSEEVCIAGLLHDLLEDTNTKPEELRSLFGDAITELVVANTKNAKITDKKVRTEDLIKRSATHSQKSAIIKSADILDNIEYYKKVKNQENLNAMRQRAKMLIENLPSEYEDNIFEELRNEIL